MADKLIISIGNNHVILKEPEYWKQLRDLVEHYLESGKSSATGKHLDKVEELLKRNGAAKITDLERWLPENVSKTSLPRK